MSSVASSSRGSPEQSAVVDADSTVLHIARPPKHKDSRRSSRTSGGSSRSSSVAHISIRRASETSAEHAGQFSTDSQEPSHTTSAGTLYRMQRSDSDQSQYSYEEPASPLTTSSGLSDRLTSHPPASLFLGSQTTSPPPRSASLPSPVQHSFSRNGSLQSQTSAATTPTGSEDLTYGHSREPTEMMPTPTRETPPIIQHHEPTAAPTEDSDELDLMAEIESAIEAASAGEPSPLDTPNANQPSAAADQQHSDELNLKIAATESQEVEDASAPSSAGLQADLNEDVQETLDLSEEQQEDVSSLLSPSMYSTGSTASRVARRQSAYTARDPITRSTSTSAVPTGPSHQQMALLKHARQIPACAEYRDVVTLKTSGERALAYAKKINALSRQSTGLEVWIGLQRQTPRQQNGSLGVVASAESTKGSMDTMSWLARRSSSSPAKQQRPPLRHEPSVDFNMRPDAHKATDLTSYAQQLAPASFAPTNMPYPGALPATSRSGSISHSVSSSSISQPTSFSNPFSSSPVKNVPISRGKGFLSLGRRSSSRSGPASPHRTSSQARTISGPVLQSLERPSLTVTGPRASISGSSDNYLSPMSSRQSSQYTVSSVEVDRLADVLPHASKQQLATYIRTSGGDSTLALQRFLEDERQGQLMQ